MKLYSQNEWDQIPWSESEQAHWLKTLLEPILKEGIEPFISNIKSELYILHIDDLFIPLTVNNQEYNNSYVCSIYSYLLYAQEEMQRHHQYLLQTLLFPFLSLLKACFKIFKINKLVTVNNLFLSTNLYDPISSDQARSIAHFLTKSFPHHAILFRSLNTFTEKALSRSLKNLGAKLITSRSIYFFDPATYQELPGKKRWIIEKDKKLFQQPNIKIIEHQDFKKQDAKKLALLYKLLYLDKYSSFNPQFTVRFFEEAIENKTFTLKGVSYKDEIVAVIGFFKRNGIMTTPIVGYDTALPISMGLYRMLTGLVLQEALVTSSIFHMSSGVGHFKRQRGAFQELETMAVLTTHLPLYRKFLWNILSVLFNSIAAPILKKYKL